MKKLAFLFLALAGCAHQAISESDQHDVADRYRGEKMELAQSFIVTPFFRDDSRRLLLRVPPDEDVLMVTPEGLPILPGTQQAILPAGTRVTVSKITFPGGWQTVERGLLTPRDRPWVELTVEGKKEPAYVLMLPPNLKDQVEARKVIESLITAQAIGVEIETKLPEADKRAVESRVLTLGVSGRAMELAWGPPLTRDEHIKIHDGVKSTTAEWTWLSERKKRVAHLADDQLLTLDEVPLEDVPSLVPNRVSVP